MHAFAPIARHPLIAFVITVVLAFSSMGMVLWRDNAVLAADSFRLFSLFAWLGT